MTSYIALINNFQVILMDSLYRNGNRSCTAGLNEIIPLFNPDDLSEKAELKIIQTASLPQHPTLRRHKMKVAFFKEDGSIVA